MERDLGQEVLTRRFKKKPASYMYFDCERLKQKAAALAAKGVYIGTSSWKYEGWLGQLYSPARYLKVTKDAKKQSDEDWFPELRVEPKPESPAKVDMDLFEAECLSEYAEVFKTVCFDGAYYKFPSRMSLESMAAQVPADFRFGFKATGEVTIKRFPHHRRHGPRAGKPNENFLNADLFALAFIKPCESIRARVGIIMFEFSHMYQSDFKHVDAFVEALDSFFGRLPKGLAFGDRVAQRGLVNTSLLCLPRSPQSRPRFQLLGTDADGWRTDGACGEQAEPSSRCRTIPSETRPEIRRCERKIQALCPNPGRVS